MNIKTPKITIPSINIRLEILIVLAVIAFVFSCLFAGACIQLFRSSQEGMQSEQKRNDFTALAQHISDEINIDQLTPADMEKILHELKESGVLNDVFCKDTTTENKTTENVPSTASYYETKSYFEKDIDYSKPPVIEGYTPKHKTKETNDKNRKPRFTRFTDHEKMIKLGNNAQRIAKNFRNNNTFDNNNNTFDNVNHIFFTGS